MGSDVTSGSLPRQIFPPKEKERRRGARAHWITARFFTIRAAPGSLRNRPRTVNRGTARVNYELYFLHIKVF